MVGFLPFSFKELWDLEVLLVHTAHTSMLSVSSYRSGGFISTSWGSASQNPKGLPWFHQSLSVHGLSPGLPHPHPLVAESPWRATGGA